MTQGNPPRIVEQYEAGRDRAVEYPLKRFRHTFRSPVGKSINCALRATVTPT